MTHTTADYLELAELAGGFIHEMKNHINTLSLNLQLLGEDFETPETPRERRALERVQRLGGECARLVELSNDFLRYARISEPNLIEADVLAVVERMVDFLTPTARAQNIAIVCHAEPDLPKVPLDVDLFERALLNLMLNAEDAMPDGGTLTLQLYLDGQHVILDVIDTGCGMTDSVLKQLFTPFITTKEHGNGLGLATTRKIVQAHRGEIRVSSQPDRGTLFSVLLPTSAGTV